MEQADRDTIELNIDSLVRATDYRRLMIVCLQEGILFDVMCAKIERTNDTEAKRHRALFRKLMTRGPAAFAALQRLCEKHFVDAVRFLRQERSTRPIAHRSAVVATPTVTIFRGRPGNDVDNTLAEYTAELPPATAFDRVLPSTMFHCNQPGQVSCYPMRSRNRGVAFLVNIIDFINRPDEPRNGADVDKVNLVQLFRQMGFTVMYYENRTSEELRSLLKELVNSRWLRSTDCFVMVLMTHGNEGKVEFYDGSVLDLRVVIDYFSNRNCPVLLHKPKVLVFPFCRGTQPEQPISAGHNKIVNNAANGRAGSQTDAAATNLAQSDDDESDNDGDDDADDDLNVNDDRAQVALKTTTTSMPGNFSDMKICYSTGWGFQAMRDPKTGSWYVESMCSIWAQHAHNKSLDDLLKLVSGNLSNKQSSDGNIQTAHNKEVGLSKNLFFNPGYYEEVPSSKVELTKVHEE